MKSLAALQEVELAASRTNTSPLALQDDVQARKEAMFQTHFQSVWMQARRQGCSPHLADDVAQDVFAVAFSKLAAIEPGKERAFLGGVTVRTAYSHLRKAKRSIDKPFDDENTASTAPSPDVALQSAQEVDLLDKLLATLPDQQREVVVMHELVQLPMREISEVLSIPPGTVASRLRRGRAGLERAMAEFKERDALV